MSCSILVPEQVSKSTFKRLQRLAKKAGVTVEQVKGTTPVYRKVRVTKTWRDSWGELHHYDTLEVDTTQVLECARITVGDMPKHNGHVFLGKIVHTEAGNMLAVAAAHQATKLPPEWREAKPTCDHCNTVRRRGETFIIQTPEGVIKRVGRNCLADFLKEDPSSLVALSVFEDELRSYSEQDPDGDGFWGGGMRWTPSVLHYLNCAFSSVETRGFVKSTGGGDTGCPTKSDAMFLAGEMPKGSSRLDIEVREDWKKRQPKVEHEIEAIGALLWLEEEVQKAAASNDYIWNLNVALRLRAIENHSMGLIASLPAAYARHLGKQAELRKAKETLPESKPLGKVGERLELTVTVTLVKPYENALGEGKVIVKGRTAEGSDIVTFASGKHPLIEQTGKQFSVRGTVKDHSAYQGRMQTVLSRCVWTLAEAVEAVA